MNKLFIVLVFSLFGCQLPPSKTEASRNGQVLNSWELIEHISGCPWNKDDVKKILGVPSSIFDRKGKDDEFWTFDDSKTEHQRFSIHFSKDNFVSLVVYIPQEYERNIFSIDNILEHWKTFHCAEKSEQRLSPGLVKVVHYFNCDGGRKFFFNKWNEVSSIDIPVLKQR